MTSYEKPQFIIVDPCLRDFVGHYYEYDASVCQAAREDGFDTQILGHIDAIPAICDLPGFKGTFPFDAWGTGFGRKLSYKEVNKLFFNRLVKSLSNRFPSEQSIVFGHMITSNQLAGWIWFIEKFARPGGPSVVLLFRFEANNYSGKLCLTAFRRLRKAIEAKSKVILVSDSRRLAVDIEALSGMPVAAVPIPVAISNLRSAIPGTEESVPLQFAVLGNARAEKGIVEVCRAIGLMQASKFRDVCKFTVQVSRPEAAVLPILTHFRNARPPNVTIIEDPLPTNEYFAILRNSHAVLLPYWQSAYPGRTSGIFCEAAASGLPVICSNNTWMSDQLGAGAAGAVCRDKSPADLKEAIERVCENYPVFRKRAIESAAVQRACNNAQNLVRTLAALTLDAKRINEHQEREHASLNEDRLLSRQDLLDAWTALQRNDIARAKGLISRILNAHQEEPQAIFLMGEILTEERESEALECYRKAIDLGWNISITFAAILRHSRRMAQADDGDIAAALSRVLGDGKELRKCFETVGPDLFAGFCRRCQGLGLKSEVYHFPLFYAMALHMQQGTLDRILELYGKALAMGGDEFTIRSLRAKLLKQRGRRFRARFERRRVRKLRSSARLAETIVI